MTAGWRRYAICLSALAVAGAADVHASGGWDTRVVKAATPLAVSRLSAAASRLPSAPSGWDAKIDYGFTAKTVEDVGALVRGARTDRPVFATFRRRFTGEGLVPYFGFGAGLADGVMKSLAGGERFAVKGVLGTGIVLERNLDLFVEYGYAVLPEAKRLDAHLLSTGLRLRLD